MSQAYVVKRYNTKQILTDSLRFCTRLSIIFTTLFSLFISAAVLNAGTFVVLFDIWALYVYVSSVFLSGIWVVLFPSSIFLALYNKFGLQEMGMHLSCYVMAPFSLLKNEKDRLVKERSLKNDCDLTPEEIEHDVDVAQIVAKITKLLVTESLRSTKAIDESDAVFSSEIHDVESRVNDKINTTDKRVDALEDKLNGNDK